MKFEDSRKKAHKAACAFIKSNLSTFWNSNFRILYVPFHWRVEWVWHSSERVLRCAIVPRYRGLPLEGDDNPS